MDSRYQMIRAFRRLERRLGYKRRRTSEPYSQRRLSLVVVAVSERLDRVHVPGMTTNLVPLLEVSGAFLQGCLDAARGVLAMARAREHGGIVAAERAAWEFWSELDYLLRQPDPPTAAVTVQVNALMELIKWLRTRGESYPEMLRRNEESLSRFEHSYPEVVHAVRDRREKGRFHWSGKSRTKVVGPTSVSADVYKLLSWETHADVLAIRDVEATIANGDGALTLYRPDDALVLALVERSASSSSECLLRAWNAFAQFWQQEELESVPPRKSA